MICLCNCVIVFFWFSFQTTTIIHDSTLLLWANLAVTFCCDDEFEFAPSTVCFDIFFLCCPTATYEKTLKSII